MFKTYEFLVKDIRFFINAENKDEALKKLDDDLSEIASDWSNPEVLGVLEEYWISDGIL